MVNRYARGEPGLLELLNRIAEGLFNNRSRLEAWSKAYLAEALAELAQRCIDDPSADKAFSLLEEIRREDPMMADLASAYVNLRLAWVCVGMPEKAWERLKAGEEALKNKGGFKSGLSENIEKYPAYWSLESPEEAIEDHYTKSWINFNFCLAHLYLEVCLIEKLSSREPRKHFGKWLKRNIKWEITLTT